MSNQIPIRQSLQRPGWFLTLWKELKHEVMESAILLDPSFRDKIWRTCDLLNVMQKGVPGHTCYLLERYLYRSLHDRSDDDEEFAKAIMAEIPLLTASCIMLASKIVSAISPAASLIRHAYNCVLGISYTIDEILTNEKKVYTILGYHVPLWTGVEIGGLLAEEIGLPSELASDIATVISTAQYSWPLINKKVPYAVVFASIYTTYNVPMLFLCAGAVALVAQWSMVPVPQDTDGRLARLTCTPENYIKSVRDAIKSTIHIND